MTQFMLGIIEITLTMSAVIALLLLLSKLFGRRFTAQCRYLIWAIVIIRLCVPFGTAFLPSLVEMELPAEITQPVEKAAPGTAPTTERLVAATHIQNPPVIVAQTVETGTAETQATLPEVPAPVFEMPSVDTICTVYSCIWLIGAAAYLIFALVRYNISIRRLRKTLTPAYSETVALYGRLCEKLKLRRAPALYVSTLVSSPMLCGYVRRRIVLPDIELSPNSLVGILAHELTHYRRHDLWVKLLCVLATSLHWFNPLVHIAAKHCNNEMELSCDERVLAGLDGDARLSYGNVMLDIIKRCRRPNGTLTTQFNPKKSAVKERFNNILDMTKKKRGLWMIAVVTAVCVIAGTVIGCSIAERDLSDNVTVIDKVTLDFTLYTAKHQSSDKQIDNVTLYNEYQLDYGSIEVFSVKDHHSDFIMKWVNGGEEIELCRDYFNYPNFNGDQFKVEKFKDILGADGFKINWSNNYNKPHTDYYIWDNGRPKLFFCGNYVVEYDIPSARTENF